MPARPDIPALLAIVRDWVAEHRDKISRAYLLAEPGVVTLFVYGQPEPWTWAEHSGLLDPLSDLDIAIANDGRFDGVFFRSEAFSSGHPTPAAAILFGDPDAAAKIADRIRTADDLREELAEARRLLSLDPYFRCGPLLLEAPPDWRRGFLDVHDATKYVVIDGCGQPCGGWLVEIIGLDCVLGVHGEWIEDYSDAEPTSCRFASPSAALAALESWRSARRGEIAAAESASQSAG